MSNNELVDVNGARILYNDLRGRIPPPVDPSIVIDDASESATDKTWSAAKIVEEQNKKAPIIIDSKSGNPIVIDDGIPGLKLYDMKVSFTPKQEGTGDPSPTNIRPITGWNGVNISRAKKNLLCVDDSLKLAFNSNYNNWTSENGIVTITGNATGGYIMPCSPSTQYSYSFASTYIGDELAARVYEFSEYPTVLSEGTLIVNDNTSVGRNVPPVRFTTTEAGRWLVVGFYGHHGSGNNITITNMQIELGSTATEYEPYSGETIPVSWQSEAGTVYGGSLDVLTGVLTVEWASKTIRWGDAIKNSPGEFMTTGYIALDYETKLAGESGVSNEHKCNAAIWMWSGEANTTPHFYVYRGSNGKCTVLIVLPNGTDEDLNIVVVSKLKEPYTVQLDHVTPLTLIATNTIWTNADGMEIAYPVDTKKYINAGARDVRINGTSILQDGVANVPPAGGDDYGVVKVKGSGRGIELDSSGFLQVSYASSGYVKAGSDARRAVVPYMQHESAFYGLAKVAGVDLAGQTITLGQYPNSAKAAIAQMLGIGQLYGSMERIADVTIAQDSDEVSVTTDIYGNAFKLAHAQVIFIFGTGVSTTNDYISSTMFDQSGFLKGLASLRLINGSKTWIIHQFDSFGGLAFTLSKSTATGNTQSAHLITFNTSDTTHGATVYNVTALTGVKFSKYNTSSTPIIAGSRVIIYGCRVIE